MPSSNIQINPEALEIYNKIKSGEYFRQLWSKVLKYKWYLLGALILILLLTAISIGRSLSKKNTSVYVPPIIDVTTPTTSVEKTSVFSALKRKILDFNTTLPDPAIPMFDNNINLEKTL